MKKWSLWKWQATNALLRRDPRLGWKFTVSMDCPVPIINADEWSFMEGLRVFGAIGDVVSGKALTIVMGVKDRNGWEAIRLLKAEFEPQGPTRTVLWRTAILSVDLVSGSHDTYETRLKEWLEEIDKFETQTGDRIADMDKCGKERAHV